MSERTPDDLHPDAAMVNQSKLAAHDAERVHAWVRSVLESSLAVKNAYAFKNRLKPFNEIVAKVRAKRNHEDPKQRKPGYTPSDLTDISGFRIVSLFNAEIPIVLGHLLDLLETPVGAGSPGRFSPDPVQEVVFFTSRRPGDPLSILDRVRNIVVAHGLPGALKTPTASEGEHTSSYSSVHVIVRSQVAVDGADALVAASEIQLRSVFEEAWGEINHRLKYAPAKRERARIGTPVAEPPGTDGIWLHLDALKSLTDGCAQYADLINSELAEDHAARSQFRPQPTDSAAQLLESFRGSPAPVFGKVEQALAIRSEATAAARRASERADTSATEHKRLFLKAGRRFAEAVDALQLAGDSIDGVQREALNNGLLGEVAYCYLFSGNAEMQVQAETIYESLIKADPNNVEALARLAQIKRDSRNLREARDLLEIALNEERNRNPAARPSQIRWLLCRNLAVLYWQIFEENRSAADAARLLELAVDLSEDAIGVAPTERQRHGASLNLLFYLAAQYARAEEPDRRRIAERAGPLLDQARREALTEAWTTGNLDTLMRAEWTFGTKQRAEEIAGMIVHRLKATMEQNVPGASHSDALRSLKADEQEYYLFAVDVLSGRDAKP